MVQIEMYVKVKGCVHHTLPPHLVDTYLSTEILYHIIYNMYVYNINISSRL